MDELKCFMYFKVPMKPQIILIRFKTAALKKSASKLTAALTECFPDSSSSDV